ncbi:MAG: DF family (seleno)protein [Acidimicrobiales bacterium]
MEIDILYVADCPHVGEARRRLRDALAEAGASAVVREVQVTTHHDAVRLGLRGSPTIRIDGRDAFAAGDEPSLACRLYRSADGVERAPSVAQLVEALLR